MSKVVIAALIMLAAAPAFGGNPPNAEKQKSPETVLKETLAKREAANKEYYEKAAAEKGTVKTKSGLLYKSLKEGTGAAPSITSIVKVNYRGTLVNGKEFNSSKKPQKHRMGRVIPCWSEALQMMKTGGKAKLVCPPELAFGDAGAGSLIPRKATVIYEIDLLGVEKD